MKAATVATSIDDGTRTNYRQQNQMIALRFADKRGTCGQQLLFLLRVDLWECEVEFLHCGHDSCGNQKPGEPFVVGRYDIPRRVFRCGSADRLFEGMHVVGPKFAFV